MKRILSILIASTLVTSVAQANRGKGRESSKESTDKVVNMIAAKQTKNAMFTQAKKLGLETSKIAAFTNSNGKVELTTTTETLNKVNSKIRVSREELDRAAESLEKSTNPSTVLLLADAVAKMESKDATERSLANAYVRSMVKALGDRSTLDFRVTKDNLDSVSEKFISENISVKDIMTWEAGARQSYIELMRTADNLQKANPGMSRVRAIDSAAKKLKLDDNFLELLANCKKAA